MRERLHPSASTYLCICQWQLGCWDRPPPDFSVMGSADGFVKHHKSGHDDAYDPTEIAADDADDTLTSNPV